MDTKRIKNYWKNLKIKKIEKKKKNILIVGGTGFIGYHLIKKCLKKNSKVTYISTSKPTSKISSKMQLRICDIRNKKIKKK